MDFPCCRTLTSAWIETVYLAYDVFLSQVALSRVRGLKQGMNQVPVNAGKSHSHECVD